MASRRNPYTFPKPQPQRKSSICPMVNAWASQNGYQSSERECIVRYVVSERKIGFLLRTLQHGPAYAYRAWQKFVAMPIRRGGGHGNPRQSACPMVLAYEMALS